MPRRRASPEAAPIARRHQNAGSWWQLADGSWRGSVTVHEPDGTTRRRFFRARRRDDVRAKVLALVAERNGEEPPVTGNRLLRDWLPDWLENVAKPTVRPSSYEKYATEVRRLSASLGALRVDELRPGHLQRFYGQLGRQSLRPATIRVTHAVIHRALGSALRQGMIAVNPSNAVELPRRDQRERAVLSLAELATLIRHVQEHADRESTLWLVLATTGLRIGEALGLRWQDLDLDAARLTVRQQQVRGRGGVGFAAPKTRQSRRTVPLMTTTVEALRAHRVRQTADQLAAAAWPPGDLVFRTRGGRPLTYKAAFLRWRPVLAAAGLPAVAIHSLRHAFASQLAALGVHPGAMRDLLGHAASSMTLDVYTHVAPGQGTAALAQFEAAIGAQAAQSDAC